MNKFLKKTANYIIGLTVDIIISFILGCLSDFVYSIDNKPSDIKILGFIIGIMIAISTVIIIERKNKKT